MNGRHIYKATDPTGKVWTRGTDRSYTHAVFTKPSDGKWCAPAFCGSRSLAERQAAKLRKWYQEPEVSIVEVDNPRKATTATTAP